MPKTYSTQAAVLISAKANNTQSKAGHPKAKDDRKFPDDCPYPACHAENIEQVGRAKKEWELTADLMQKIVCLLDENGHILRVNRAVERWGLGDVVSARGLTMHQLLHPNCVDASCSLKSFWDAISDMIGKGVSTECLIEDQSLGRYLQLVFRSSQFTADADTGIQKSIGVAVVSDISDLKLTEKKLQELNHELERRVDERTAELLAANKQLQQEIEDHKRADAELMKTREEFSLLVRTMSEGLVICNRHGFITYVNDRFCEMLGHEREGIVGYPVVDCVDESSKQDCDQLTVKMGAGLVVSNGLRLKSHKGDEVWVKVSPSLMYDDNGIVTGSFAVVTDISDLKRAEQTLRASKEQLRYLSEQVMTAQEKERQRVAGELHDGIGQTLSAVKFSVETVINRMCDNPSKELFMQLENVVPRIQGAIEEVRRISMALRPSILDDIGVLATLTWFCRESSLVYKNLQIQLQLDIKEERIPVPIKVVIFRIVQEAFNNAIKHSGAEQMHISLNQIGESIVLNIEDNGAGFDVKQAFDAKQAYVQGEGGQKGLGLTSMRERAESTGGLYAVGSVKGKGTTISVTWPIVKV